MQRPRFPRLARLGPARCAIRRRDELRVAASAASAARYEDALPFVRQIGNEAQTGYIFTEHKRAGRHRYLEVVRRLTGTIGALPVPAATGLELGVVAEIDQRVFRGNGDDGDRAGGTAVAAVRPAARDVLLAPETETTIAAGTGCDVDVDFVDEHRAQGSGPRPQLRPEAWALRPVLILRG